MKDIIRIRMLKICDESICKSPKNNFLVMFRKGKIPLRMQKSQCGSNNNMLESKSYRSISLLPFSDRIFERLLYDSMFNSFTENSLISKNQSGYKPRDSYTNQLLFIAHKVYKSFDDSQ